MGLLGCTGLPDEVVASFLFVKVGWQVGAPRTGQSGR